MKLLVDEMWSPEIARQLRLHGHDVVSVHERDQLKGKVDRVIFDGAQEEGRALVTDNAKDFRPLIATEIEERGSYFRLVLTDNHRFPRHRPGTLGRMVIALSSLLESNIDLTNRKIWLS